MKRLNQLAVYIILVFFIVLSLFVFVYHKEPTIIAPRSDTTQFTITPNDYSMHIVKDSSTPTGIKKVYFMTMDTINDRNESLSFFVVHEYTRVWIDGDLVFSEQPSAKMPQNYTLGCYWVRIPLVNRDSFKSIVIEEIPVYKSLQNQKLTFYVAGEDDFSNIILKENAPQVLLALSSIIIGLILLLITFIRYCLHRAKESSALLGIFAILIGIWKMGDTTFLPLVFNKSPRFISFMSLTAFYLSPSALMLYIKYEFKPRLEKYIDYGIFLSNTFILEVSLLQVLQIRDFREQLTMFHIVLAFDVIVVMVNIIDKYRSHKGDRAQNVMLLTFIICVCGVIMDIVMYYVFNHSVGVLYTLITFLIYIIVNAILSTFLLAHQARIDELTGLMNRSRCNDVVYNTPVVAGDAIMIFDLNDLKYTNDTLGHEAGNQMIKHFAHILSSQLPGMAFLGRYGGDEFLAMIRHCDEEQLHRIAENIAYEVKQYNQNAQFPISYATGYGLADEHTQALLDVFNCADHRMYENKKRIKEEDKK